MRPVLLGVIEEDEVDVVVVEAAPRSMAILEAALPPDVEDTGLYGAPPIPVVVPAPGVAIVGYVR